MPIIFASGSAIAVDASIVRLILVPATMKLLGRANWWLPGWLDRALPGGRHAIVLPGSAVADQPGRVFVP